jgi:hypothetical protein
MRTLPRFTQFPRSEDGSRAKGYGGELSRFGVDSRMAVTGLPTALEGGAYNSLKKVTCFQ